MTVGITASPNSTAKKELLYKQLQAVAKSRTAKADVQIDEDGKAVEKGEADGVPEQDANVLVVESNAVEYLVVCQPSIDGCHALSRPGWPGRARRVTVRRCTACPPFDKLRAGQAVAPIKSSLTEHQPLGA